MSKRNNISYIKPADPSFLTKLKAQIGYKDGPTVETKRQKLQEEDSDSGSEKDQLEREDEKPQVVVIQSGDLTEAEAVQEEQRIAREAAEAPADLSQPIVFKKRKSNKLKPNDEEDSPQSSLPTTSAKSSKRKDTNQKKQKTPLFSFNIEEEAEEYNS